MFQSITIVFVCQNQREEAQRCPTDPADRPGARLHWWVLGDMFMCLTRATGVAHALGRTLRTRCARCCPEFDMWCMSESDLRSPQHPPHPKGEWYHKSHGIVWLCQKLQKACGPMRGTEQTQVFLFTAFCLWIFLVNNGEAEEEGGEPLRKKWTCSSKIGGYPEEKHGSAKARWWNPSEGFAREMSRHVVSPWRLQNRAPFRQTNRIKTDTFLVSHAPEMAAGWSQLLGRKPLFGHRHSWSPDDISHWLWGSHDLYSMLIFVFLGELFQQYIVGNIWSKYVPIKWSNINKCGKLAFNFMPHLGQNFHIFFASCQMRVLMAALQLSHSSH